MEIAIVAAVSQNGVMGINNTLPWYIKEDLQHFKTITTANRIIMGKNTYLSLKKPLPNRQNVVISLSLKKNDVPEGVIICRSLEEMLNLPHYHNEIGYYQTFCIGGEQIYQQILPYVNTMYLTEIEKDFDGDTYFPKWDRNDWECTVKVHGKDSTPELSYTFAVYRRKIK